MKDLQERLEEFKLKYHTAKDNINVATTAEITAKKDYDWYAERVKDLQQKLSEAQCGYSKAEDTFKEKEQEVAEAEKGLTELIGDYKTTTITSLQESAQKLREREMLYKNPEFGKLSESPELAKYQQVVTTYETNKDNDIIEVALRPGYEDAKEQIVKIQSAQNISAGVYVIKEDDGKTSIYISSSNDDSSQVGSLGANLVDAVAIALIQAEETNASVDEDEGILVWKATQDYTAIVKALKEQNPKQFDEAKVQYVVVENSLENLVQKQVFTKVMREPVYQREIVVTANGEVASKTELNSGEKDQKYVSISYISAIVGVSQSNLSNKWRKEKGGAVDFKNEGDHVFMDLEASIAFAEEKYSANLGKLEILNGSEVLDYIVSRAQKELGESTPDRGEFAKKIRAAEKSGQVNLYRGKSERAVSSNYALNPFIQTAILRSRLHQYEEGQTLTFAEAANLMGVEEFKVERWVRTGKVIAQDGKIKPKSLNQFTINHNLSLRGHWFPRKAKKRT